MTSSLERTFGRSFFLLALAFYPLVETIGGAVEIDGGMPLRPFIAPALIVIGALMLRTVGSIDWKDPTEYLPAFLPMVIIPFSFEIHEGIAFGFIAYSALKLFTLRGREAHPLLHFLAEEIDGRHRAFGVELADRPVHRDVPLLLHLLVDGACLLVGGEV